MSAQFNRGFRFSILETSTLCFLRCVFYGRSRPTEIVLAALLSHFILESTGDEVIWQNPVITSPTHKDSKQGEPCLNLRVMAIGEDDV
jgi:hypothetical protein